MSDPSGGINTGMIDSMNRSAGNSKSSADFFKTLTGVGELEGLFTETNFGSGFSGQNIKGLLELMTAGGRGDTILGQFFDIFESKEEMWKNTMGSGMGFAGGEGGDSGGDYSGGGDDGSNRPFSGMPSTAALGGGIEDVSPSMLGNLSPSQTPSQGIGGIEMGM